MLQLLDDWPQWNLTSQKPQPGQIELLPGGLTNQSFMLHLSSGDYVLRLEAGNSGELDINREREYQIHQQAAAAGLVPEIIFRSQGKHKYWIRRYIAGELLTPETLNQDTLIQMVQALRRLHQLPVSGDLPLISLTQKGGRYLQTIAAQQSAPAGLLTLAEQLLQQFEPLPDSQPCVCHLDPTLGNWIRTAHGLQLLDWEYAGLAHPLWDLAALCQDVHLSEYHQQQLLDHYFGAGQWRSSQWRYARNQMALLAALWYGAQQIWSLPELETYLLSLQAVNL